MPKKIINSNNYWISNTAVRFVLNAMSDANKVMASISSGSVFMAYDEEVPGLGYDDSHNYRRWKLSLSNIAFADDEAKYVYVAIPKPDSNVSQDYAFFAFPSEEIDVYGNIYQTDDKGNEYPVQVGASEYYYVWLGGIIGAVEGGKREWKSDCIYGKLSTSQGLVENISGDWWKIDVITDTIAFLKIISSAIITNLTATVAKIKLLVLNGVSLNSVAKEETPIETGDAIVTPSYLKSIADKFFLHKNKEDAAQFLITFLKGIKTAGIKNDGNNITKGLTELYDVIKSHGFNNSMTAGSGWQIDKQGNAQVESIEVRSYMRVLELVMNRLSAEESEFIFTESGTVETATFNEKDGSYTLTMRKKTDKDITPFQQGDILKGVMNDLTKDGAVGANFYTSWMKVTDEPKGNSITVAVYADDNTPAKQNFPPRELMVLHRWGNADETKKERQSCWYISSIEKRIVMLDGVTQPITTEENLASFYGLPFDMETFKGYSLKKNQPYLYVRGAFLQDVCFIDYLGKVVKQERYRGVWSQEVAISKDPYIVTQTTFDTVYHKNAKWQCNSTKGTKEEPSVGTTDWTKLSEGGKGSDGKSAAKAYVTSNDIAIPTDANGVVTENFQIGNTFSLMVDGKNCTDLKVTMDGTPATNAFKAQLNQLWLTISSSKGAELGLLAYTLHFTVKGVLDNVTYSDVVTILVRPNRAGTDGKNLTRVSNFYKWGDSGTEAPSDGYIENAIPQHTEGLDYLWNYEVCYNDAGETISTSEKTCIGNFARGIETITEYYQIGTAEKPDKPISVDTIDASGWQTTMPSLTAEKRYLWNLEVVRFTDGTYSISEVHLAGAQGDSITIEQKLVFYAISASGTSTPPDTWFGDTIKEPTEEKPYLWTCVSIRYSDTTVVKYYTVARRGENGASGRNLTKVVNYYKWGARGTQAPSGDYTENNIPEHVDGLDYLWNYEVCYSDNDELSRSGKTCIGYFPKDGKPGKEGKGIKSITEYYQVGTERKPAAISISTDGTTVTIPSGWEKTMGTTTADNRFVWNQEVIEYSNSTYSVTAVHLAGAQGDQGVKGDKGDQGDKGENGADGALPNLFGYDTKVECLVGHHNVVHTNTGFALALDSISDDDTSSDRYCLLRIKDFTDGEGTYSVSGYITHSAGGKFEFDCGDVTPQTMTLTANKRTRFAKKFELPKNSYKHIDFEFFRSGLINVEELKIERTDNVVSECTPFVMLAHDSITQKQNILLDTNFTKTNDRTIWNVFNGDIVENAYNSLSAFHYKDTRSSSITTAVEILSQKFVGKLKPSTWYTLSMFTKVKGKVILYIGSNVTRNWNQTGKNKGADAVLCDEYIVSTSATTNTHQLEESTEYKRHSITFCTAPDLTNADERMYFYIWAQAEIYVTMLKLEECEKPTAWQLNEADRMGKKGKPLVGPTEWNASADYMSGKADNEPYQSIVINPKYPKQMYLCGYSHKNVEPSSLTSTSSVDTCTEDQPWVQVPYQDFVATKVLFAAKSLIKDLNAETIEMLDDNGNRLFYLKGGKLECNVGTFKNITAIGGTFKDIEVTGNSTFKGALNGVTGSFRELNCVGPNGKVAGGIKFDNSRMYFDGDLYSQGYNDAKKRGNRFYASDVWCRGNFGHRGKAMAVVYGDYMMAYPNGLEDSDGDRSAVRVNLTQKTTVSGKTFYEIPLYSPDSNGESNDVAGMPIDVVVFNITNTSKEWLYKFTRLSSGKEWRVFNANNNYGSLYIADTGTWRKLPGGANASYIYVPPKFLTPAMSSDIIGAGVFVSYISDIDW